MIRVDADRLRSFVDRLEKLDEERRAISGDMRDVVEEAKAAGFNPKTLRKLLTLRKQDSADREADDGRLAAYAHALGMDIGASVVYAQVSEAPSDEVIDARALRAVEMLSNGASIRDVVKATGMGHGSVQRLRQHLLSFGVPHPVPQDDGTPPHDPATGEITPSPAGGEISSDASPPQAASQSSREVPAGEPIETDRPGNDDGAPEGAAEGVKPPTPDPDAGWQARDGHDSFILALQVANGKVPHPADASHIVPIRSDRTAADAGPLPVFLDRRARHA